MAGLAIPPRNVCSCVSRSTPAFPVRGCERRPRREPGREAEGARMRARSWAPALLAVAVVLAALVGVRGRTCRLRDPVAAPGFSPEGGAYDGALEVTLRTDTEGAGIRYTVDGSTPSAIHGRPYDGFPFTVSSSVTIRAVAWMAGSLRTRRWPRSPTPSRAPPRRRWRSPPMPRSGPFDPGQLVTMSTGTPGAEIWYTTDGSDPRPRTGTEPRTSACPWRSTRQRP